MCLTVQVLSVCYSIPVSFLWTSGVPIGVAVQRRSGYLTICSVMGGSCDSNIALLNACLGQPSFLATSAQLTLSAQQQQLQQQQAASSEIVMRFSSKSRSASVVAHKKLTGFLPDIIGSLKAAKVADAGWHISPNMPVGPGPGGSPHSLSIAPTRATFGQAGVPLPGSFLTTQAV